MRLAPSSPSMKSRLFWRDRPTVCFHVDAVQALAKVATEVYLLERVDFATFSSHKFHGLHESACLHQRRQKITPLSPTGGGQEKE